MREFNTSPHPAVLRDTQSERQTIWQDKTALRATGAVLFLGLVGLVTSACGDREVAAKPAAANSERSQGNAKSATPAILSAPGDGARIPMELRALAAAKCHISAGSSGRINPDTIYICGEDGENKFSMAYHRKGSAMTEVYHLNPLRFIGGIAGTCVGGKKFLGEIYEKKGTTKMPEDDRPECYDGDFTFEDLDDSSSEPLPR